MNYYFALSLYKNSYLSMTEIISTEGSEKVYINEILKDLIPGFLASRLQELLYMQKIIDEKDFEAITRFGHKIKGSNLNYGFTTLGKISSALEQAGSDKNSACAQTLLEQMRRHLNNIEIIFIKDDD
jgi:HPt (histidine-containing phosphotransfer) domain-containing protein